MSGLTVAGWQQDVDTWARGMGGYFSPLSQMAQLTEEVGELARLINRVHGDQSFKKGERDESGIPDEMADVIFTVTCLANSLGVDLTEALRRNEDKRVTRDRERHLNNPKLSTSKLTGTEG